MSGTLYIVATPIGNLEDITMRALRVLKEVDMIVAEDTRVSAKLLIHYEIDKHTLSYHQHSDFAKKDEILMALISGKNIALITDAGTPGISDPGNELIAYLLECEPNLAIVPIPGASALVSTLSISGLDINKFVFLGFMPKKKRTKLFEWLKVGKMAFAYYDSPYRVVKNLQEVSTVFGSDVEVCVARELTKMYESTYRGKPGEVIEQLTKVKVKGEIVVVVSGKF